MTVRPPAAPIGAPTRYLPVSAAALGCVAGLAAGAVDFIAVFHGPSALSDRLQLGVRLLASEAIAGAAAGLVLGILFALLQMVAHRRGWGEPTLDRWAPGYAAVLALPACGTLAWLLLSGGRMSQLAGRPAIAAGITLALMAIVAAIIRLCLATLRRPTRSRRFAAACCVGGAVGLSFIDQHALPHLYEYLHGALTVTVWLLLLASLLLLGAGAALINRRARSLFALLLPLGAATAALASPPNHTVRAAMLGPRASHSHSLQLAVMLAMPEEGPRRRREHVARSTREEPTAATDLAANATAAPALAEGAHILLVTIDALRADHLGMYGYGRGVSPALDTFAEGAAVFEQAYAAAPHSSYSLCSLLASQHLHQTTRLGYGLPSDTLPVALTAEGYRTGALYTPGIFHTEGEQLSMYRDNHFGFAEANLDDLDAAQRTDATLSMVDSIVAAGEPPSLIWTHYFDVHEPYRETRLGTSDVDRYDGEIQNVDTAFARLLEEVDARFSRDVIVVVTADHGEEFREHGGVYHGSTLFEEQVRVPLLIRAPGVSARRVRQPTSLVSLAPTLLELVGVETPLSMHGTSLVPLLRADPAANDAVAFAAVDRQRMVVDWPYKLVADLRFNTFKLFNLETDPEERVNLADREPERMAAMREQIFTWLDELHARGAASDDPRLTALALGRLRDRRAVRALGELLLDETAEIDMRREAGQLLARLADPISTPTLVTALSTAPPVVAAEAAIALGRLYDDQGHAWLLRVATRQRLPSDADLRMRASVSLGRLRDPAAVPALIETLEHTDDEYEREEAVRWLGRLRDPRGFEPLAQAMEQYRLRVLAIRALGHLGDLRAVPLLERVLAEGTHLNFRNAAVLALGKLAHQPSRDALTALAIREPELTNMGETLVRLDAIGAGLIGGADVGPESRGLVGFTGCIRGPLIDDWNYTERTRCRTNADRASVALSVPESLREAEADLVVRLRRVDTAAPTSLSICLGGACQDVMVSGQWSEARSRHPASLPRRQLELRATGAARFEVDHVLLLPAASNGPLGG